MSIEKVTVNRDEVIAAFRDHRGRARIPHAGRSGRLHREGEPAVKYLVGGEFVVDSYEEAEELARDYDDLFGIIVSIEEYHGD